MHYKSGLDTSVTQASGSRKFHPMVTVSSLSANNPFSKSSQTNLLLFCRSDKTCGLLEHFMAAVDNLI